MVEIAVGMPKGRVGKIIMFGALFTISLVTSILLFANVSNTEAYTNISVDPATKSVKIEVPAQLPSSSVTLNKWLPSSGSSTNKTLDVLVAGDGQTIQSKINNDHQTFNFEKINFPVGTGIIKIELVATAKKGGPQTTKMSLDFAKGIINSDLPPGGIPMTTGYVNYTRDVTNHPDTTTPVSLLEISTWQVGGTGVPITFGVAQNTDGKTVLLDRLVLKINFTDNIAPISESSSCDVTEVNGWCPSSATEHITATDTTPGAGVKEIHYILDGTETTFPGAATNVIISGDGTHDFEFWAVDKVGNIEWRDNFKEINIDTTAPTTTARINGADPPFASSYAPGAVVTLSCTDGSGDVSGVDKIEYKLTGDTYTTYVSVITVSNPGLTTISYHCLDLAGNQEIPDNQLPVTIQAATVTINSPITDIKWKELLTITGTTTYTVNDDQVSVDWGDGTTPDVWPIDDIDGDVNDGTWSATHTYGPIGNAGTVKTITATVVNGGNTVSLSDSEDVTLLPRDTTISLEDITNIVQDAYVYLRGNLRDEDGSGVLPGRTITFTNAPPVVLGPPGSIVNGPVTITQGTNTVTADFLNSGAAGLNVGSELSTFAGDTGSIVNGPVTITQGTNKVTATFTDSGSAGLDAGSELSTFVASQTGAIEIFDNSGITQGTCGGSNSIVLHEGAEITVPGNPVYADIVFCEPPTTFNLSIEGVGGSSSVAVDLDSSNPPPISDASGISKITIGTLPVGTTTVEIFNLAGRNADDQELFNTGFSSIATKLSVDGKTFFSSDGIFATKGTGPNTVSSGNLITASFGGDNDYNEALPAATKSYNVDYKSTGSGIGNDVTVIADIGDIITFKPCDADNPPNAANDDTDVDGICDSFESITAGNAPNYALLPAPANTPAGIPYTSGWNPVQTRYLVLTDSKIGVKDIFVDIDGFTNHVNSAALDDVKMRFNTGHNMNIRLVSSDTGITEVTPINIWRDTNTARNNDYDSIKADYFGNAADRATFSGQSNAGSGTTATFSSVLITTPADAGSSPVNSVHGTITLKMKLNLSGDPGSSPALAQTSASCTNPGGLLNITPSDITSTFANGSPPATQKILTTKIKFKTAGIVTGADIGICSINLSLNGKTISSVAAENVSPILYTEKQLAMLNAYRHVLFAHSIGGPSGRSEVRGNDAVIALGAYDVINGHAIGSQDQQAGTLLHELGHLFNLDHGGPRWLMPAGQVVNPPVLAQSGINCKPTYASVMSYGRQLPTSYLDTVVGGGAGGWKLDYSNGRLPNLSEIAPSESLGLPSNDAIIANNAVVTIIQRTNTVTATFTDAQIPVNGLTAGSELSSFTGATASIVNGRVTIIQGNTIGVATFTDSNANGLDLGTELSAINVTPRIVWGISASPYYKTGYVTLAGIPTIPLDWNGSGGIALIAAGTRVDLNNLRIFGCQASVGVSDPTVFEDANDWANMDLRLLGSSNFGDGYFIDDIDDSQFAGIERSNANFIIIPPPSPDGTEVRNPNSALPIKIDLKKLSDGSDIIDGAIYAEWYTCNPATLQCTTPTFIGGATYDTALSHYQIPWKMPKTKGTTYYIDVYVDLPTKTSLPPSVSDKAQDRHLDTNSVTATFTDAQNPVNGLTAGTELSAFAGAANAIGNGQVTITQGVNSVTAIFTNSGSSGLESGSELSSFDNLDGGGAAAFTNGPVTITQVLKDITGKLITIKVTSSS